MTWVKRHFFSLLVTKVLFLVILFPFVSCEDEIVSVRDEQLNTPFSLKIGEQVRLQPDNVLVGFRNVIQDSRCPSDVMCVWEGIADLKLWLRKPGTDSVFVKGSIYGYVTETTTGRHLAIDTLGYRLKLLQLDPYPRWLQPLDPFRYTARIVVSRI